MTRLRSVAQRAPQTDEAAAALCARFAALDGDLVVIEEERRSSLATIDAVADAAALPLIDEMKRIAKTLKPWWAANIERLTGGRRKSHELGGCVLGYRISPPKVHFAGGTDDQAVTSLVDRAAELAALAEADADLDRARLSLALQQLVRTKLSPDKPGILTMLGGDDAGELAALGFSSRQKEEFFLDRVGARPAIAAGGDDAAEAVH